MRIISKLETTFYKDVLKMQEITQVSSLKRSIGVTVKRSFKKIEANMLCFMQSECDTVMRAIPFFAHETMMS